MSFDNDDDEVSFTLRDHIALFRGQMERPICAKGYPPGCPACTNGLVHGHGREMEPKAVVAAGCDQCNFLEALDE